MRVHLLDALTHALLQDAALRVLVLELVEAPERALEASLQLRVVRLQAAVVLPADIATSSPIKINTS